MKIRMKKRTFLKPVILGFVLLYLVSVSLSTWLMKCKFEDDYKQNITMRASSIQSIVREESRNRGWQGDSLEKNQKNYLKMLLSGICTMTDSKYQLISAAIYDMEGKLEAESQNVIGATYYDDKTKEYEYLYYALEDYLTEEEIRKLAEYQNKINQGDPDKPAQYLGSVEVEQDSLELAAIQIYEAWWTEGEETVASAKLPSKFQGYFVTAGNANYYMSACSSVWDWKNPSLKQDTERIQLEFMGNFAAFPGIQHGIKYWEKWQEETYLHNFPETIDDNYISLEQYYSKITNQAADSEDSIADVIIPIYFGDDSEHVYSLIFRNITHPWVAAMNYMKYVYLGGIFLMLVCAAAVIYAMNRTYEQQTRLEEMRRDFTNAIAHELKTPLSVVRGFTENLKENTNEQKKDYYLDKIVEQTEEMDQMVRKMCDISKLDSEQLVLQKESVDLLELFQEQEKKVQSLIAEMDLDVEYRLRGEFQLEGDRYYLGKALLNLFSNAAEYNRRNGNILITVDPAFCSIENTGDPIPEEKLAFAGNLFYSGDENRSYQRKHLGLGLYLAERIFELHHLKMKIENTESGVRVIVQKRSEK